jgi:hypothetical protein
LLILGSIIVDFFDSSWWLILHNGIGVSLSRSSKAVYIVRSAFYKDTVWITSNGKNQIRKHLVPLILLKRMVGKAIWIIEFSSLTKSFEPVMIIMSFKFPENFAPSIVILSSEILFSYFSLQSVSMNVLSSD